MKTLLSEIKKFRSFIKLNENFSDVRIALIGDGLIYYLKDNELQEIPELVGEDFTIRKLLKELLSVGEFPDVDHVYVSIGLNDRFEDTKNIPFLVDQLDETFPNAEKYVIKAIVDDEYFYGTDDEKELEMIEDEISSYYNIFERNGINVIGDYDSIDNTLGFSNNKINQIKNQIEKSLFQNVVDVKTSLTPTVADEPFTISNNVDISGDDATDFDTIYEFLERFEEIVDSKNNYDSRIGSSFKADIEQIQIVLNFLNPSYPIELTGKYDTETEEAVYEYQIKNNLPETGLCDHETLEEMLYDLKAKSFDDDDLGKYLQQIVGYEIFDTKKELKKFTGSVDSVWKGFTDKIIDNFEGGYWNKDRTKPSDEICSNHPYDPIYDNSGETLFGIDRRAGEWDKVPAGREFFEVIDNEKDNAKDMTEFCKTWTYGYRGGSLESELKLRASSLMKDSYDSNTKYFSSETKKAVESDKRLLFHFAYACWNGPGFFQDFANDMNDAVNEGKVGDDLVDVAIESRNNAFSGTGWDSANKKVINIIQNDPSLKN
jgi:peptidoglycan hydrolase-like protein with peptidoglycan-binding domain